MTVTVSKPGEIADVPIGVIVGSIIGGLLLLALAVGLMWKVGIYECSPKICIFFVWIMYINSLELVNQTKKICSGKCI